jgi:hypothetical protein
MSPSPRLSGLLVLTMPREGRNQIALLTTEAISTDEANRRRADGAPTYWPIMPQCEILASVFRTAMTSSPPTYEGSPITAKK